MPTSPQKCGKVREARIAHKTPRFAGGPAHRGPCSQTGELFSAAGKVSPLTPDRTALGGNLDSNGPAEANWFVGPALAESFRDYGVFVLHHLHSGATPAHLPAQLTGGWWRPIIVDWL